MDNNQTGDGARPRGWRDWLGLSTRNDEETGGISSLGNPGREPTQREIWLPAKRRLLAQVTDFLIDHDLEVLPFTLTIAHDCVTGSSPRLAQKIHERTERGLPVTLRWLEEASATLARDSAAEALANLAEQLGKGVRDIHETMVDARDATGTYAQALAGHVDNLHACASGDDMLVQLTALTTRMLDHTRGVERDLAATEIRLIQVQHQLDEARRQANQDHLTGLPNRRAFEEMFEREEREARLGGETLCIAFCDIDHFKRINDAHGHPTGDRVIRYVAETLGRIANAKCHVARHGGEEFAVLLRGENLTSAWGRLDAARDQIAEKCLVNRVTDQPLGKITFSGGIADALAYPTRAAAMKAADDALYQAKQGGRNRILIASEAPPTPVSKAA